MRIMGLDCAVESRVLLKFLICSKEITIDWKKFFGDGESELIDGLFHGRAGVAGDGRA